MHICTFFGHRDCPGYIEPVLKDTITRLITTENVKRFYVGDSGGFDKMVAGVLRELKNIYTDICFLVVLAYLPAKQYGSSASEITFLPEGIENVPPRFAIEYRNNYMLSKSDFVITYTINSAGGAAKFEKKAIRLNKTVINIAKINNK